MNDETHWTWTTTGLVGVVNLVEMGIKANVPISEAHAQQLADQGRRLIKLSEDAIDLVKNPS